MKRRDFIVLLSSMAAWPTAAPAQQERRMRRIGFLMSYREGDQEGEQRLSAFRESLRQAGWIEGQTAQMDVRWFNGDPKLANDHAKQLVEQLPDVIVANGTPAVAALRRLTKSIPIVFVVVVDPVGAGFVESLSRPGGNITGFSTFEPQIGGKWVELLKEIAPSTNQVGVLMDPDFRGFSELWKTIESTSANFGLRATALKVRDSAEIEKAIEGFARQKNGGLIALPTPVNSVQRAQIFALAIQHRLPAIYPFSFLTRGGGLLSYGFDSVDLFKRAAPYVARILNGDRARDLPVQGPTKYELVINLKTAKALGLIVPPSLLSRADELIE
jgi:putative ABC transport system substrate-binding protein